MSFATPLDRAGYPEELRNPAAGAETACRVCGQRRPSREPDSLWIQDGEPDPRGPRRTVKNEHGDLVDELLPQAWTWRHRACLPTAACVVAGVLGFDVREDWARAMTNIADVGSAKHHNRTGRSPWAFVGSSQRKVMRAELDRLALIGVPRKHVAGRCGWCGRSRSPEWSLSGLVWAGTNDPAPLCAVCAEAKLTAGHSYEEDATRRRAMRLFVGLQDGVGMSGNYGFKYAAEVVPADRRHEDKSAPWSYSRGLATVKAAAIDAEAGYLIDPAARERWLRVQWARRERILREQAAAEVRPEPPIAW